MRYLITIFLFFNILIAFEFKNSKERVTRFEITPLTVYDKWTKLLWQRKTGKKNLSWREAKRYCKNLKMAGHSDWVLPHIDELMSIVDKNSYSPTIDKKAFPHTDVNDYYWSSTTAVEDRSKAWLLFFDYGYTYNYYKDDKKGSVRCLIHSSHLKKKRKSNFK